MRPRRNALPRSCATHLFKRSWPLKRAATGSNGSETRCQRRAPCLRGYDQVTLLLCPAGPLPDRCHGSMSSSRRSSVVNAVFGYPSEWI